MKFRTQVEANGDAEPAGDGGSESAAAHSEIETTPGRLFFNNALPDDLPFINHVIGKRGGHENDDEFGELAIRTTMSALVEELAETYAKSVVATSLDKIKDLAFRYASQSGLTISIDDVNTPPEKAAILDKYEKEAEKAEAQFKRGIITDDERRQKEIEIWTSANSEVGRAMDKSLAMVKFNPLDMMIDSGARGNSQQVRQIAGMKGLVSNPRGEMIPRPIISSFREGLSVLEYFISTHGARKGLADTALRTADSGYLTRRLVDVAQELIIREVDCGTTRGLWLEDVMPDQPGKRTYLETRSVRSPSHRAGRRVRYRDGVDRRGHRRPARQPRPQPHPGPFGPHVRGAARCMRSVLRPFVGHRVRHRDG